MSEAKFSYKEVITHGWEMTKKYMKTIAVLTVVYLIYNVVSGVPGMFAGADHVTQREVKQAFRDSTEADRLYLSFQETGYIDSRGSVQEKLQQLTSASDLIIPSDLQDKREEIYNFLNHYRYRLPFPKAIYYLIAIAFWLIGTVISIGYVKVNLMMSRDQKPDIAELFSNGHLLIPYLLGGLCYGLAVTGGFILLIIPGIILMLMFQMYSYLIIDRGMGPIEALKHSRVITKGSRGRLFVLGLLIMLLNLGGALCLLIGLFFTVSVSSIALAYVYDHLEKANGSDGTMLKDAAAV